MFQLVPACGDVRVLLLSLYLTPRFPSLTGEIKIYGTMDMGLEQIWHESSFLFVLKN